MAQVLIVTGGGKGLGRAIILAYAQRQPEQKSLTIVLLGRDENTLQATAAELQALKSVEKVIVQPVDLGQIDALPNLLRSLEAKVSEVPGFFTVATLVNNAGSLGDIAHTIKDVDVLEYRSFFDFNITSMAIICTWFLRLFDERRSGRRVVVNISSLMAIQPFPFWGMYCSAKAARDSLINVIAKEEANSNVKALNYAPGPLNGDMQHVVRNTIGDADQKSYFTSSFLEGKLVELDASAAKLINILFENTYQSGSHIDYYD